MNSQLETAVRRARGYWFIDGFIEMAAGAFFVLLTVVLLGLTGATGGPLEVWLLVTVGAIGLVKLLALMLAVWLIVWLKDRFTFPRTGFVRGRRITAGWILAMIRNLLLLLVLPVSGLLTLAILVSSASAVLKSMPVWFPAALGLLWASLLLVSGEWMGLRRFRTVAAFVLAAGIATGLWQAASGAGAPALLRPGIVSAEFQASVGRTLAGLCALVVGSGAILFASGLLTFLRYRRENPTPYAENA
jgi:hypothetical protein